MKNFVQDGRVIDVTLAAAIAAGAALLAGKMFGVAATSGEIGDTVALHVEGVFELPKTSALAITAGDTLYWDNAAKELNKTATGNTKVGYATADAANPSATVHVKLTPGAA